MKLTGHFHFEHFRDGAKLEDRDFSNLIVNGGFAEVAGFIVFGSTAPFTYIAIGTDTQSAATTDISLYAELTTGGAARALATASRVTTDVADDTAQLVKTFTFTTSSSYDISEAAVFNAVTTSSGTMLCRQTFTPITVVSADTLQVTYRLDID